MTLAPLLNKTKNPRRQTALYERARIDGNDSMKVAVSRVKMWWLVIIVEHGHHDPEKSANLRHAHSSRRVRNSDHNHILARVVSLTAKPNTAGRFASARTFPLLFPPAVFLF